jgi:hypothetical protein
MLCFSGQHICGQTFAQGDQAQPVKGIKPLQIAFPLNHWLHQLLAEAEAAALSLHAVPPEHRV